MNEFEQNNAIVLKRVCKIKHSRSCFYIYL